MVDAFLGTVGILLLLSSIVMAIIQRKTRLKFWLCGCLIGLALFCIGVYMSPDSITTSQQKVEEQAEQQKQQQIKNEILENINVSYELQDVFYKGKQKLVIAVKNNSQHTFSGDLYVQVVDNVFDKEIAHEYFNINKLGPNLSTYGIMWIEPSSIDVKYKFISIRPE